MMKLKLGLAACVFPVGFGIFSKSLWKGEEDVEDIMDCTGTDGTFYHPGGCSQHPKTSCTKHQLPSFLYVGQSHAGSTTYAWQLNIHPNLSYGLIKEHNYFTVANPDISSMQTDLEGYREQFNVDCIVQHTFDASPHGVYLSHADSGANPPCGFPWRNPGTAALMDLRRTLGQDLKIILMIRDPIDWAMTPMTSMENFEHVLEKQSESLCLANYVDGWLEVFPRSQMLFLASEDYFADARSTLAETFRFLDVPPYEYADEELKPFGRRRQPSSQIITDEFRAKWHAEPHNKECKRRLEVATGLHFKWKGSVDDE